LNSVNRTVANVPTHSGVSVARRGIPGRYNTFSPR